MVSLLRSYRSYLVVVVAVAAIVWFPASRDDEGGPTGLASTDSAATAQGTSVSGQVGVDGAASGDPNAVGSAAVDGAAGAASGGSPGAGQPGDPSATSPGGGAAPVPSGDAAAFPGIGSAEALASPKCDPQRQQVLFPS